MMSFEPRASGWGWRLGADATEGAGRVPKDAHKPQGSGRNGRRGTRLPWRVRCEARARHGRRVPLRTGGAISDAPQPPAPTAPADKQCRRRRVPISRDSGGEQEKRGNGAPPCGMSGELGPRSARSVRACAHGAQTQAAARVFKRAAAQDR